MPDCHGETGLCFVIINVMYLIPRDLRVLCRGKYYGIVQGQVLRDTKVVIYGSDCVSKISIAELSIKIVLLKSVNSTLSNTLQSTACAICAVVSGVGGGGGGVK